ISLGYNLAALGNYLYHSSGPEQVLRDTQSVLSKTPIFLQNFKNELQDTYVKQVTHGDTESQAHYFTYLGGTIASLFGSSATKAGSIGGKASKLEKGANISKKAASKIKKVKKPLVPQMQVAGIPINVFSFEGLQKAAIQFIKKLFDHHKGARGGTRGTVVVENMSKFFKLPFGKSIKNSVKKTNGTYNGATVWKVIDKHSGSPYLNKGDRFYIDTESFDHLEVFDKRGRARFVLDMNGNVIEAKTKAALKNKRTIPKFD
ncbi:hypothetical protein PJ311_10885, partial [Bacillus sp. CLL-7-23]|nr:hypothetical protein [Bacillus changyiensis]